jgi:SEC-C motif-containing protein
MSMSQCPCGSGRDFESCCGPVIAGTAPAPTAEALMRARYSAFATGTPAFLHSSLAPEAAADYSPEETEAWAKNSQWKGLEIVATEAGGEADEVGTVEFIARYRMNGKDYAHHELSRFRKEKGRWMYVDGVIPKPAQRVVANKVGRNDPCPCGSGKKYKKCCGAAA